MTIEYAILGILSLRPMTGYDLKKVMQDSQFMHWSGNNNQIYKALVELLEQEYVQNEVQHQDGAPSKKIYTITQTGREALAGWSASVPEIPECKKPFLTQLAFADALSDEELHKLLLAYEHEVWMQLQMCRERARRGGGFAARSDREALLWEMIDDNVEQGWLTELNWVRRLRERLAQRAAEKEKTRMKYTIAEREGARIIEVLAYEGGLGGAKDAMEIISLCAEHDCGLVLLHAGALKPEFFQLKTGAAGDMLQKFVNYRVRTALLLEEGAPALSARFRELMGEANKGSQYRFFTQRDAAEKWLLDGR